LPVGTVRRKVTSATRIQLCGRLDGRGELTLELPDDAWVDWEVAHDGLQRARAALRAEDWRGAWGPAQAALAIADRGLLPGLEARWIDDRRAELADLRIEALEAVASIGAHLGGAELPAAEQAARAAVEAAPFRESARAALIEALRARGNVAEALRTYEDLRVLLREELGTTPGPALVALHERLLHADGAVRGQAPDTVHADGAVRGQAPDTLDPASSVIRDRPRSPSTVARALPDRLAAAASTPLVGRADALARLQEALGQARAGQTGLVLILGEGGIGKTRLIAELARGAEDFAVLYGRCDEEELFPFGPWIEMLVDHLANVPDEELGPLLGDHAPDLARLVPALKQRLPGLAEPPPSDPETQRQRLFGAFTGLVPRLAQRSPLVMVVDDLHWADRSSLQMGRQLVRSAPLGPVLMLGTYRDTELHPGHPLTEILADLEREVGELERLRLEGLAEEEVAEIVGDRAEAETVRRIREETGGNPFFVKQLARHLDAAGTGVPAGVRDVIARNVARLPEEAGRVLRVGALIGRDFDLGVLERVVDVSEDDLLDLLDEAVRAGILVEVASHPGRYSFAHALLRTTLEEELSATRRARLHRRIGEALERHHRDRLDPWLGDLARHFAAAGPEEADRAVAYAVRAATQALDRLAYDEAVELLRGALAAREADEPVDEAERARLLHELAGAVWRTGAWTEARTLWARACAAARAGDAGVLFAEAALGHSGGAWERYGTEDPESVALLEEALRLLPAEDAPLRARVAARLGGVLYYSPDSERRSQELVDDAIAMARRLGDEYALSTALAAAQYAYWRPGLQERRLELADELVALTAASGIPEREAEARAWRAIVLLDLCRIDRADEDLGCFFDLAGRLQQPELMVHAAAFRSMRALLDGRWADAEAAATEVLSLGERSEAVDALQFYGVEMIALRGEQLRLGELVPHFERLVREVGALPGWRTALAWGYAQSGRAELAREQFEALREEGFRALPRDANFVPACAILSHIAGELGDAEMAAALEPMLRPEARYWVVLGPGPATLGPVSYALGLLSALLGDLDRAEADFRDAIARAEGMRATPYVAHAQAGLATVLRRRAAGGDAGEAGQLEAAALATAEALDMPRLLRDLGVGAAPPA
jgi:hypothetical protein